MAFLWGIVERREEFIGGLSICLKPWCFSLWVMFHRHPLRRGQGLPAPSVLPHLYLPLPTTVAGFLQLLTVRRWVKQTHCISMNPSVVGSTTQGPVVGMGLQDQHMVPSPEFSSWKHTEQDRPTWCPPLTPTNSHQIPPFFPRPLSQKMYPTQDWGFLGVSILTFHIWQLWILTTDWKLWCPHLECGLLTCPEDSGKWLDQEKQKKKRGNTFLFISKDTLPLVGIT